MSTFEQQPGGLSKSDKTDPTLAASAPRPGPVIPTTMDIAHDPSRNQVPTPLPLQNGANLKGGLASQNGPLWDWRAPVGGDGGGLSYSRDADGMLIVQAQAPAAEGGHIVRLRITPEDVLKMRVALAQMDLR